MEQPEHLHSFPELSLAIANGFNDNFRILMDGSLQCLSCSDKFYELEDIEIKVISSSFRNATLYLITTRDGLFKGPLVEYWESYS